MIGAYLIGRHRTKAFLELLGALETPDVRLFCTGPWPPYSFVRGSALLRPPDADKLR